MPTLRPAACAPRAVAAAVSLLLMSLLLVTLLVAAPPVAAQPVAAPRTPVASAPLPPLSSAAERIYDGSRVKLLQIRTLVAVTGRQSSIGSGFLVSGDGFAITNYHVISQYALEPQSYRLEYTGADGTRGALTLAAFDLANDLAVVRLDKSSESFFPFDERALAGTTPHGERLYSMGNPLDLGFTITEGTYNGLVERSYNERIHFSGALNPGMSGGPTVTTEGRVAGINVAKRLGGEQVAFLVPARFAAALLERAKRDPVISPGEARAEIARQLDVWQDGFYASVMALGFRSSSFGPYRALESEAPWFSCWGRTSDGQVPKPRATMNATVCSSDTQLFIADDLNTGAIQFSHSYFRSVDLNSFQFASFLSGHAGRGWRGGGRKWFTRERCHEDFVGARATEDGPPLRVVWCARAYREFEGLYDVSMTTVTQDRGDQALVSWLSLRAVSYDNAVTLTRRYIEAVTWTK